MTFETAVVDVDKEFAVRLTSTPTTGYVWEVAALPEGVQLLGSDFEKSADSIQPGDPVTQVLRFHALKAGQHIITFVLKRRWEQQALESHTVEVTIR